MGLKQALPGNPKPQTPKPNQRNIPPPGTIGPVDPGVHRNSWDHRNPEKLQWPPLMKSTARHGWVLGLGVQGLGF